MNDNLLILSNKLRLLLSSEEGQDLIEYALTIALIAFGATAAMHTLSNDINNVFLNVGNTLSNAVT
jgi:pilus assembly protein Flp/PilA